MDRIGAGWKQDLLLARRVKRNPEDAWAWQQLAFRRLLAYHGAEEKRREKLHTRIVALLAQCDRTAPDTPRTLQAHALWAEFRGCWPEAVALWLEAIDEEPGNFHNYQRLWECT